MKFETNKIPKDEFSKINEDDILFITNPGRMGDEDGLTFIIKKNNEFKIYRLEELMYIRNKKSSIDQYISLNDALNQFPKWANTWKNNNTEQDKGKYKYLYMGFGNGLSVDKSIYDEYKPYLDAKVQEYLEDKENKESLKYAAIFNVWKQAFIEMIKNQNH